MTDNLQKPAGKIALTRHAPTFGEVSRDVLTQTTTTPSHGDGSPITVNPNSNTTFLAIGLTRFLTPEEFGAVYMGFMQMIAQLEQQGLIESGIIKQDEIATAFDIPAIDGFEELFDGTYNAETEMLKAKLTGTLGLEFFKELIPVEAEEEPEPEPDPEPAE
jgi:hypothetical protein